MQGSASTYAKTLFARAWCETWRLFFQKTRQVFIRDVVVAAGVIALLYALQPPLVSAGLVPQASNLSLNRALPLAAGVIVFIGVYALYLLAELLVVSPYRLWCDREPSPAPPRSSMVDDDTKRLAGVVMALRDRVLIHGFKTPVTYEDPYYAWLHDIENSTHPIWIEDQPRAARIEFVHASKVLPYLNMKGDGEREEFDHWRQLVKERASELIGYLRGAHYSEG